MPKENTTCYCFRGQNEIIIIIIKHAYEEGKRRTNQTIKPDHANTVDNFCRLLYHRIVHMNIEYLSFENINVYSNRSNEKRCNGGSESDRKRRNEEKMNGEATHSVCERNAYRST